MEDDGWLADDTAAAVASVSPDVDLAEAPATAAIGANNGPSRCSSDTAGGSSSSDDEAAVVPPRKPRRVIDPAKLALLQQRLAVKTVQMKIERYGINPKQVAAAGRRGPKALADLVWSAEDASRKAHQRAAKRKCFLRCHQPEVSAASIVAS
jgi:hypothetical protein